MAKTAWPTPEEKHAFGVKLRDQLRRTDQGRWPRTKTRANIAEAFVAANEGRVARLLPIKVKRMSISPFAFFRGSAFLMGGDLAELPVTGLTVQLCGDAHVRNLGAFAAPDGHLVFDLNDFDESIPGPWEWDLKRLACSVILAGREAGDSDSRCEDAVLSLMAYYRQSLDQFASMKAIELAKFEIRRRSCTGIVRELLQKAERLTPDKTLKKLTSTDGSALPQFHGQPPFLEGVSDQVRRRVIAALSPYRETLSAGRRQVFDAYHPVDVAFKIVGTGSVGTRDYVILLLGNGLDDPMFLQVKEELPSCYTPYLPHLPRFKHQGQRVAQGQQRVQSVSDPFLGWTSIGGSDYLVRQLADHKASIDPGELKNAALIEYANVCGEALAKAHARTGDAAALAGYCGGSDKLDGAISKFALAYADQVTADYVLFQTAIKAGKIKAADSAVAPELPRKK